MPLSSAITLVSFIMKLWMITCVKIQFNSRLSVSGIAQNKIDLQVLRSLEESCGHWAGKMTKYISLNQHMMIWYDWCQNTYETLSLTFKSDFNIYMQNIDLLYSGETAIRRRKNEVRFQLKFVFKYWIIIIHILLYFFTRMIRKPPVCWLCVGATGVTSQKRSFWITLGHMWRLVPAQWFRVR